MYKLSIEIYRQKEVFPDIVEFGNNFTFSEACAMIDLVCLMPEYLKDGLADGWGGDGMVKDDAREDGAISVYLNVKEV